MIKISRILLLIFVFSSLCSCLYIPTPDHAGNSTIPDEVLNNLIPGKTTLADVLLKFGKPAQRIEDDHYLLYHWTTLVGYMLLPGGAILPNSNLQYLCLEFTSDNILKRYKHFEQGSVGVIGEHPEDQLIDWMGETHSKNTD